MKQSIKQILLITLLTWFSTEYSAITAAQSSSVEPSSSWLEAAADESQTMTVKKASYAKGAVAEQSWQELRQPRAMAPEASKAKKEAPPTLTQLLTIFLDNYEVPTDDKHATVTSIFLNALYDQAGPIIASSSLLYNLMSGPYAKRNPLIAEHFKNYFNNGKEWILLEAQEHLMIIIPPLYLTTRNITLQEVGLNIDQATPIGIEDIEQRYKSFSQNDWTALDATTGIHFVSALTGQEFTKSDLNDLYKKNDNKAPKHSSIFDTHNQNIKWVIYLNGHSQYKSDIASIPLQQFPLVLDFCNTKINTALFIYSSCYAAGHAADFIYGELTKAGETKVYPFPIVTQAITDAPVRGRVITYKNNQLLLPYNFNEFINSFTTHRWAHEQWSLKQNYPSTDIIKSPYEKSLVHIMPYLKAYQNEIAKSFHQRGDLPQIRYPNSPGWFPVIESTTSIVRISDTMALTRTRPLLIGTPIPLKPVLSKEKFKHKTHFVHTVLIDATYIPFDIVIADGSSPYFIITKPGDLIVHLQKIIQNNPMDMTDFSKMMSLDVTKQKQPFYKGNKQLHITELIITSHYAWFTPTTYYDILIDYVTDTLYYTDNHTKQWILNEQGTQPCPYDYRLQFPDPLQTSHAFREKQQSKIAALQKIHKTGTHTLPHYVKASQAHVNPHLHEKIDAQDEKIDAQDKEHAHATIPIPVAQPSHVSLIKQKITHIQHAIAPYAELFEPHLQILKTLYEQELPTDEDIVTINTIENDVHHFLLWPQATKIQLLVIINHVKHIVDAIQHMPTIPADTKQNIEDTFHDLKNLLYKKSGQLGIANVDSIILNTFITYEKLIMKEYKPFEIRK